MDIQGNIEVLEGFPERDIPRLVQVVAEGVIVDQGSAHAKLVDGAPQLGGCLLRILEGNGGQPGEPPGTVAYPTKPSRDPVRRQPAGGGYGFGYA